MSYAIFSIPNNHKLRFHPSRNIADDKRLVPYKYRGYLLNLNAEIKFALHFTDTQFICAENENFHKYRFSLCRKQSSLYRLECSGFFFFVPRCCLVHGLNHGVFHCVVRFTNILR